MFFFYTIKNLFVEWKDSINETTDGKKKTVFNSVHDELDNILVSVVLFDI